MAPCKIRAKGERNETNSVNQAYNPNWNQERRIQGQTDIPLNELGRAEARKLSTKLIILGIQSIISSNLSRASETADIVNQELKLPLSFDQRLRECSFGFLEGLTKEEAVEKYGTEILKPWNDQFDSYDFTKYGGENKERVLRRHLELLDEINLDKTVLLVGHGRGLNTLLAGKDYEPDLIKGGYRIISI